MHLNRALAVTRDAIRRVGAEALNSYIVIGGAISGNMTAAMANAGADLVWDLWNETFCGFTYVGGGFSVIPVVVGANASVYTGIGFGLFENIHAAWSGTFHGATVSVGLETFGVLGISADFQGFKSPDFAMKGLAAGATGSASVPMAPETITGNVTISSGEWTPNNSLTRTVAPRDAPLDRLNGYDWARLSRGVGWTARHMARVIRPVDPMTTKFWAGIATWATAISAIKTATARQYGRDDVRPEDAMRAFIR